MLNLSFTKQDKFWFAMMFDSALSTLHFICPFFGKENYTSRHCSIFCADIILFLFVLPLFQLKIVLLFEKVATQSEPFGQNRGSFNIYQLMRKCVNVVPFTSLVIHAVWQAIHLFYITL